MKKSPKSMPEPICLTDFRQKFPNDDWDSFRNTDCYTEVRATTRRDQSGLCAYCEINLIEDNEQIAHFHPKSDVSVVHNWALDWENLWLACKGGTQNWQQADPERYLPPLSDNCSCDEAKGNLIVDGLVFSPAEIPPFPRIFRFEQFPDAIHIAVDEDACNQAGIPITKAHETIQRFNLNCTRLSQARLALCKQLNRAVQTLQQSGRVSQYNYQALARKHLSKTPQGYWPRFFTLIRWRLGTFAEEYLHSINYDG